MYKEKSSIYLREKPNFLYNQKGTKERKDKI